MKDKYICSCCGGRVNRITMTCEYCGTQYDDTDRGLLRIETFHNPVVTLCAQTVIDSYAVKTIGEEATSEIIQQRLSREMAEAIKGIMRYDFDFDPRYMQIKARGTIKAVVPKEQGEISLSRSVAGNSLLRNL